MERVTCRTARSSARVPEIPALEKGRLIEEVCPDGIVKEVAVPMVLPFAPMKETVPVHEAAVPAAVAVATFVRFTLAVSVLPNPKGGKFRVRANVPVLVWPHAAAAVQPAKKRSAEVPR